MGWTSKRTIAEATTKPQSKWIVCIETSRRANKNYCHHSLVLGSVRFCSICLLVTMIWWQFWRTLSIHIALDIGSDYLFVSFVCSLTQRAFISINFSSFPFIHAHLSIIHSVRQSSFNFAITFTMKSLASEYVCSVPKIVVKHTNIGWCQTCGDSDMNWCLRTQQRALPQHFAAISE